MPSDIIQGKSTTPARRAAPDTPSRATAKESKTVLPKDFKVKFGHQRLVDIRGELINLTRQYNPNAGAVLLRVFLELAIADYLGRVGEMPKIIKRLEGKGNRLPFPVPALKYLVPEILDLAKKQLPRAEAAKVEKALRYDEAAPFSISELHAFVHSSDLPSDRDIRQFWLRTEPLFRMMLERAPEGPKE